MKLAERVVYGLVFSTVLYFAVQAAHQRGWTDRIASEAKIESDVSAFMRDIGTCEALHSISVANQCHVQIGAQP